MRWFVDNGRCKGLIASKHLLRDGHNQRLSSNLPHSCVGTGPSMTTVPVTQAGNGGPPRALSSSTNRATPLRPTSLTSNGSSGVSPPTVVLTGSRPGQAPASTALDAAPTQSSVINTPAITAATAESSFSNGNAIYGNIEPESRPPTEHQTTQRQTDRLTGRVAALNGEGARVRDCFLSDWLLYCPLT